mmetsp:Transcript_34381/g.60428  ORF Transcript_34381/g.60428 Transcript_34381/m.60428 type:complete len:261 (-) Transcript_34381:53-835(-)
MTALEVLQEVIYHAVVEVLSSQVGVTSRGLNLENSLFDREKGDIKSSATEIKDEDVLLLTLLVQTIGNGRGCGLVDDPQHVESRNGSSILRRLPLRVVEVSRHGHDSVLHLLAQIGLSDLTHLREDHGADLLGLELLRLAFVLHLDDGRASRSGHDRKGPVLHVGLDSGITELAADEALGIEDGVGSVHGGLGLGGVADETLGLREGDIGWRGAVTLVVRDDFHAVILPDADATVGGTEVDADRFSSDSCHDCFVVVESR